MNKSNNAYCERVARFQDWAAEKKLCLNEEFSGESYKYTDKTTAFAWEVWQAAEKGNEHAS